MADLYVDVDALSELSRQLEQIKTSLQRAQQDVNANDPSLASSRIRDALDDFVGGWKDGRQKIIEGIDALLGSVHGAVDAYQQQEQGLSKAARGES